MMYAITIFGQKGYYYTQEEGYPQEFPSGVQVTPNKWVAQLWERLRQSPNHVGDLRFIIFEIRRNGSTGPFENPVWGSYVNMIHWDDSIDLIALDGLVRDGMYNNEGFRHIHEVSPVIVVCARCKWKALALALIGGSPASPYNLDLIAVMKDEAMRRFSAGHLISECPNCGYELRRSIVKVYEIIEHGTYQA